jgi:hypothetical protein
MSDKVADGMLTDKPYLSPASFNRKHKTLTESQALSIKVMLSMGRRKTAIARHFKVTYNTVHAISRGVTWANLDATAMIAKVTLPDSVW